MFGTPKRHYGPRKKEEERKPFVSTARKVSTFGSPPPLKTQQQQNTHKNQKGPQEMTDVEERSSSVSHAVVAPPPPPPPGPERVVHSSKFLKQSVRWLNLTISFWSMIIVDANRVVDMSSLNSFITAMFWRLHGEIEEDEFTEVFREWMGRSGPVLPRRNNSSVFLARDSLLDFSSKEGDLDLLIGMVINETNKRLIDTPLSFDARDNNIGIKPTLDLCTRSWLSLSEELFFLLDEPGFGCLGFDQMYFFVACMVLAKNEWVLESEAEEALSLTNITAFTVALMRECGANVDINFPDADELKKMAVERKRSAALLRRQSMSVSSQRGRSGSVYRLPSSIDEDSEAHSATEMQRKLSNVEKCNVVTLCMFKKFLVGRGLGEHGLISLVSHVRSCCSLLGTVGFKQSPGLYEACTTYSSSELPEESGCPRPFHRCVYAVAGWPLPGASSGPVSSEQSDVEEDNRSNKMSPILLYMLSDVEGSLPALWYSSAELELSLLAQNDNDTSDEDISAQHDIRKFMDNLTHDVSRRIWMRFSSWGDKALDPGSKYDNVPEHSQLNKEPTFQFIMSVLSEYKSMLLLMNAALVDIAMDHFCEGVARSSAIAVASTAILPDDVSSLIADITKKLPSIFPHEHEHVNNKNSVSDDGAEATALVQLHPHPELEEQSDTKSDDEDIAQLTPSNRFINNASPLNALFGSTTLNESSNEGKASDSQRKKEATDDDFKEENKEQKNEDTRQMTRSVSNEKSSPKSPIMSAPSKINMKTYRMEDLVDSGCEFSNWVNATPESLAENSTNSSPANLNEMEREVKEATWSNVFGGDEPVTNHSNNDDNNTTNSANRSEQQENRSIESNKSLTETSPHMEKKEFFKTAEVSDEGSPGTHDRISILSGQFESHLTEASERRHRRKHRQMARTKSREASTPHQSSLPKKLENDFQSHKKTKEETPATFRLGLDSDPESPEQEYRSNRLSENDVDVSSIASSTSMANSVLELLEKGQTAGIYAQSLRDLLRKMSRDDTNINLKSLEKIIELGNSIVENEEVAQMNRNASRRSDGSASPRSSPLSPKHRQRSPPSFSSQTSPLRKEGQHREQPQSQRSPPRHSERGDSNVSSSRPSQSFSEKRYAGRANKDAKRRIPGVVPTPRSRNSKQAFA